MDTDSETKDTLTSAKRGGTEPRHHKGSPLATSSRLSGSIWVHLRFRWKEDNSGLLEVRIHPAQHPLPHVGCVLMAHTRVDAALEIRFPAVELIGSFHN